MESKFKKGSRVSHPKYGKGTITTINGDYDRCHIRRDADDELVNLLIEDLTLLDAPETDSPARTGCGTTMLPTVEHKYDRAAFAFGFAKTMLGNVPDFNPDTMGVLPAAAVTMADQLIAELQRTAK
jgi:hypothetical protein